MAHREQLFSSLDEGLMYTLEDDEETTAHLRKRDFLNSPYAAQSDGQGTAPSTLEPDKPAPAISARTALSSPRFVPKDVRTPWKP